MLSASRLRCGHEADKVKAGAHRVRVFGLGGAFLGLGSLNSKAMPKWSYLGEIAMRQRDAVKELDRKIETVRAQLKIARDNQIRLEAELGALLDARELLEPKRKPAV